MSTQFRQNIKLSNPIHLLAVGFGSGLAPKAPGTFGSLAAIPFWLLFNHLGVMSYWLLVLVTAIAGCWICQRTSDDTGTHDSGHIVWDEMVGMWMTLYFVPKFNLGWIVLAFVLFRLFDIVKPWPIRWLDQKVTGGVGIMVDDIVAALFAIIVLSALGIAYYTLY